MLRQTVCAHYSAKKETERERKREREKEKKRGKNSTQFYALLVFLLLVFVSQKGREVSDVEDEDEGRWVGEESKKRKHMKGTYFFCFFFYIIFMLSKIL